MTAPDSYSTLLQPLAAQGVRVVVPSLYPRGLSTLLGRVSVVEEAERAVALIQSIVADAPGVRIFIGGHSRGGQAAFRAARSLGRDTLAGLVLIDPVDGQGRNPVKRTATSQTSVLGMATLIVGAGIGGRCAPEDVNHDQFADAIPEARHVIVSELGHADMLDDKPRTTGRRLCGGSTDPDLGRLACIELMSWAVLDDCSSDPTTWLSDEVRDVVQIRR